MVKKFLIFNFKSGRPGRYRMIEVDSQRLRPSQALVTLSAQRGQKGGGYGAENLFYSFICSSGPNPPEGICGVIFTRNKDFYKWSQLPFRGYPVPCCESEESRGGNGSGCLPGFYLTQWSHLLLR